MIFGQTGGANGLPLGLDIPKLNALRATAIEPFLDDDLTTEEMQKFVSGYLIKDTSGQFGEFWTTIRHLFAHYNIAPAIR